MSARFDGIDMRLKPECYPCFLRQANIALEQAGASLETRHRVLRAILSDIKRADPEKTPAHASSGMHRSIRRLLRVDPFRGVKARYNRKALALYPELKQVVGQSHRALDTAAKLAIAGNVIDFGIYRSVDIKGTIKRALEEPLAVDDFDAFDQALGRVSRVLYLLDNAGEVVFDRLLIEELRARGKKVTAVVKAGPVLNDCTILDAGEAGLTGVCKVVDTGSDMVGTILEDTSRSFRERFARTDQLIISKGQGNFETLLNEKKNIFFLFQAKCEVVAGLLGLPTGSMLLADGRAE